MSFFPATMKDWNNFVLLPSYHKGLGQPCPSQLPSRTGITLSYFPATIKDWDNLVLPSYHQGLKQLARWQSQQELQTSIVTFSLRISSYFLCLIHNSSCVCRLGEEYGYGSPGEVSKRDMFSAVIICIMVLLLLIQCDAYYHNFFKCFWHCSGVLLHVVFKVLSL